MGAEPDPKPGNQRPLKQKELVPAAESIVAGAPKAHSGMPFMAQAGHLGLLKVVSPRS